MFSLSTVRTLKTFLLILLGFYGNAQCGYDFSNGSSSVGLTPGDCSSQLFTGFDAGTMTTVCGLEPGFEFTFSFCAPGALATFDSQITVFDQGGGSVVTYNDDACGLASEVSFSYFGAPGGCVDVVIDSYFCSDGGGGTGTLSVSCFEIPPPPPPGPNDCLGAEVVCNNDAIAFVPDGAGIDDFANPANDEGCLVSDENQSAWYYFEVTDDTPPGSSLEFTISPDGGSGEDYDFAVYGPDVPCDNLGSPVRCSYAASGCAFCPQTGLGMGATDFSEGAGGDGFVAGITVFPGQGFWIVVDNYLGNSSGFSLTWGGTAADYLNCTPDCELEASANTDGSYCAGESINISGTILNNTGSATGQWTADPPVAVTYLSSSNNPNPTVNIPQDATGTITYTFTATEGDCEDSDDVTITILPPPPTNPASLESCDDGSGFAIFDLTQVEGTVGSGIFTWYEDPNANPPAIPDPTNYSSSGGSVYVVVTDPSTACESAPQEVILTIDTPNCDDGCEFTDDSVDADCNCVNTPNPPNCDDGDCNTDDSYDPAACACVNTPIPPPDCDDNDCNTDDSYDSATCTCINTPVPPPNCDDNDCNTDDSYNPTTCQCENTPIPPPDCDDGDCNTDDTYDAVTCTCVNTPIPPPDCDDNDCTTDDAYNSVTCQCENTPISPPDCDDGDCNTDDTYNTTICQCENTPIPPPDCDDNNCTTDDAYNSVTCQCENTPIPPPDCDDGDCNTNDTYNTTICQCENTPIPPPDCDDNNCTTDDSYDAVTCSCVNTPIPPLDCDDNDCNTDDAYNPATCQCENTPIPPPDCDDGDCNTDDTYDAVTCTCINTPIPPPDCNDNDCTTDDAYNSVTCQCENTPIPPPDCDDGDCNTDDIFNTTTCQCENTPVTPPDCDDNDCTTDDAYNSVTCQCENTPIPPPDCDDGNCNTDDTYNTTICQCENTPIPPPDCDDGDCNTDDSYDAVSCTCVNTPIPPPNCDDNDCTTDDTYNSATCQCENTPIPPPDCDDGDCNTDDAYNTATCQCENTPIPPPSCDDGCNLTVDTYNPADCSCENTPPDPDDGCALTVDTYDAANCLIVNTPPDPDDGCDLTTDTYDAANCQIVNTPPDPVDGCPLTADSYDAANCQIINTPPDPDDGCPLTTDSFDETNCQIINEEPDPDDGCSLTVDTYDAANCQIVNTPPDPDDDCDLTTDSYDAANCLIINDAPDCDDGCPLTSDFFDLTNCACINTPPDPDDGCNLTADIFDDINCIIINTPPDPDDGCNLTDDIWDGVNCQIINTPPDCGDGCPLTIDTFNPTACACEYTEPDPDDGCDLTTDSFNAASCTITNTPPNPDDGCPLTADNFDPTTCTIVNIPPDCDDGCAFTDDTFNAAICACEYTPITPDCDDNDCGTTDTYDEANCQCINTPLPPPTAFPAALSACETSNGNGTFDLTSVNEIVNGGMGSPIVWVDGNGVDIPNATNYSSGTGTVTAVVFDTQSPPCLSTTSVVTLAVIPAANAGTPLPPAFFCENQSAPVNLADYLDGEAPGGTWTEFSVPPSAPGSFNATSGTFTPSGSEAGTYIFSYFTEGTGNCPGQSAEVTINLTEDAFAVLSTNSLTTCNTATAGSVLDLQGMITDGDANGFWFDNAGTGVNLSDPDNVDFVGIDPGSYLFFYTTNAAVEPCENTTYELTVLVEDCACPSVATAPGQDICNDSGTIDLTEMQLTSEVGFWTITATPTGGNPAVINGNTFDATNADAGDYEVTFNLDVFPGPGCPESSSQIITVNSVPLPAGPGDQTVCNNYTLPTITGTNLSPAAAYFTGANGTGTMYTAGDLVNFSDTLYIYDDNGACSGETSFNLTVNPTPSLDNPGDQTACDSYVLPEITGANLDGTEGYYSQSGGSGTSYNAGDIITENTEIFLYAANGDCSDEESFTVEISVTPNLDNPGAQTVCGDFVLPEITGSNLNGSEGYYSQPGGNGTNYPVGSSIAANGNIYIYAADGSCSDSEVFSVVITTAPDAGTPTDVLEVCNDVANPILLSGLLTGQDAGGIWSEVSDTPSTGSAFNAAAGVFNSDGQAAGIYEFTYGFSGGNCPPAEATVTVSVSSAPSAEFSQTNINTCNVAAQGSVVNLSALIIGGEETGIWTAADGSTVTDPGAIDFDGAAEGAMTYTYTLTATGGICPDQVYFVDVFVEDCACPSVATTAPDGSLCNDFGVLNLNDLLVTSEPGNWTITQSPAGTNPAVLQGNNFSAAGADAGDYEVTFTLAVTPPAGCPESSTQTITVDALPQITSPGDLTGCESVILPAINGMNITDAAYYSASNGGGTEYATGDEITDAGTYFIQAQNGACTSEIAFEVIINQPPAAGTPLAGPVLCDDADETLTLADLLTGADTGGTWTEVSDAPSAGNAFNAAAGTFNGLGQAAGVYEFTYNVAGATPCPDAATTVSVTVESAPSTDFSAFTVNVCNVTTQGSTVDLTALITGGDTSGTWTDATGTAVADAANLDFDGSTPGSEIITYTTGGATAPCENTGYEIEVLIEDCACPSTATSAPDVLCNDAGTTDLSTLQITSEAGTWSITDTPSGSNPATLTGSIFDAMNADAGDYELTFTLNEMPLPGCPTQSVQTLTVNPSVDAGTGSAGEICDTEENALTLADYLTGADTGGIWSLNGGSAVPTAGAFNAATGEFSPLMQSPAVYIFDYTVTGTAPCPNAVASVTINVNGCECPSVELADAVPSCTDAGITDLTTLQVTSESGTWSLTQTPTGSNPATLTGTTFNATNADAGIYEVSFTLDVTPPAGCATANSVEIIVNAPPTAGTGGSTSQCNEDGTIDLSALLSGNDAGGTWSLNSGSAMTTAGAFDAATATFDPTDNAEGIYIFDYTVSGDVPCPAATTSVTVTLVSCDCPSVELTTPQPICQDENLDLADLQVTNEPGTWSIADAPAGNTASLNGSIFEANMTAAGNYVLEFTLTEAPPAGCPTSNTVILSVSGNVDAGTGGQTTQCNEDGIISLADLLTGSDAGGLWTLNSVSQMPTAGAFSAATATFNPTDNAEGVYIFDYTVSGNAPCADDVTSVTVTIVACACPSVELLTPQPICYDETVDLTDLEVTNEAGNWTIGDTPAGSTAMISGNTFNANQTPAGVYILVFTLNEIPPNGCDESNSVILNISNPLSAGTALAAPEFCAGAEETVILADLLTAEDTGGAWTETSVIPSTGGAFAAATGTFATANQAVGIYTFAYTVGNAGDICPPTSTAVTVEIHAIPTVSAGEDMMIDCNIISVTLTGVSSGGEDVDFTWENEDGAPIGSSNTIEVDTPGDFIVTVDENGCTATDSVTVTADQNAPNIDAGEDVELDCDESSFVIEAFGDTGDEFDYDWTTTNGEIENPDVLTPTVTDAGTYGVVITNTLNGCTSSDQVVISFLNGITGIDAQAEGPDCYGENDGYIFVTSVEGGTQPVNFNLNDENFADDQAFTSLGAGLYELTLTDVNGCMWDTLIVFDEMKEPELELGDSQLIPFGESAEVVAVTNFGVIDTVIWEAPDSLTYECLTSDCLEISLNPTETVTLQVTVYDENGCAMTDFITIVVERESNVYVPNAFSPNSDGENELLYIFADESVESIGSFLIFDRWGENVFSYYNFLPNDSFYGWDGMHNGEPLNAQVLVWTAEVRFIDGRTEVLKGDVTLMR